MPIWRPEAIVFDAIETLFDPTPLSESFEQAGLAGTALNVWLARVQLDGIAHTAAGTFVSFQELATYHLRDMLRVHIVEASTHIEQILIAYRAIRAHPDVEEGLEHIRHGEVRRAMMTNEPAELTSHWLERGGLRHHFEQVFDASAAMAWKPGPAPYAHAARELGSAPERTAMISSHPWDIHGATCAGLVGAWLNRHGTKYPEMMNPPHVQAATLQELGDRLLHLPRW